MCQALRKKIIIHKENYEFLPERFIAKIEQDIEFLVNTDIPELKKIYLFGSCARGEVRSTSDIDLLILTRHKIADRALAADVRWTLDEPKAGVRTDVVYKNEESEKMNTVFDNLVEKDKKLILEVIG